MKFLKKVCAISTLEEFSFIRDIASKNHHIVDKNSPVELKETAQLLQAKPISISYLAFLVLSGNTETAKNVLEKEPSLIRQKERLGYTLPHLATIMGQKEFLAFLKTIENPIASTTDFGLSVCDIEKMTSNPLLEIPYPLKERSALSFDQASELSRTFSLYPQVSRSFFLMSYFLPIRKTLPSDVLTQLTKSYDTFYENKDALHPCYINKIHDQYGEALRGQWELRARRELSPGSILPHNGEIHGYIAKNEGTDPTDPPLKLTIHQIPGKNSLTYLANDSFPNARLFEFPYKNILVTVLLVVKEIPADAPIVIDYGGYHDVKSVHFEMNQ